MLENYETLKEQNVLIDKQAQLIHKLADIIENNGLGFLLDNTNFSSADYLKNELLGNKTMPTSGPVNYGPGSPPVVWMGGMTDMVSINVGGVICKAAIMDQEILWMYNHLLNVRRRIPLYKQDIKEEDKIAVNCTALIKTFERELETFDLDEEQIKIRKEELEKLPGAVVAALERRDFLQSKLKGFEYTKEVLEGRLTRYIRAVLIRSEERKVEPTLDLVKDLRESRIAKYKDGPYPAVKASYFDEEDNVPQFPNQPLELPDPAPASDGGDDADEGA